MYIFNAVHPDKGITDRYIATGHGLSQLFFHRRFCITSKGCKVCVFAGVFKPRGLGMFCNMFLYFNYILITVSK